MKDLCTFYHLKKIIILQEILPKKENLLYQYILKISRIDLNYKDDSESL